MTDRQTSTESLPVSRTIMSSSPRPLCSLSYPLWCVIIPFVVCPPLAAKYFGTGVVATRVYKERHQVGKLITTLPDQVQKVRQFVSFVLPILTSVY